MAAINLRCVKGTHDDKQGRLTFKILTCISSCVILGPVTKLDFERVTEESIGGLMKNDYMDAKREQNNFTRCLFWKCCPS